MTRDETFTIEDGLLVRRVVPQPGRGEPYQHTCTKKVFDDVTYAIEQMGAGSFTDEDIRAEIDAPSTQVTVAMAFLKERGSIMPAHQRKHKAATDFVYEDALIEWHALRENPEEAAS